jgi:CheY-like chemotaxis protein
MVVEVLLVEDNPADVELIRQGFLECDVSCNLNVVGDGREAWEFLHRQGPYLQAPRPSLILLDLNLPRMNGREFLAECKEEDSLKVIPVIVLTTLAADSDIRESYRLHANAFVQKPLDFDEFLDVVRNIGAHWFHLVKLPTVE